MPMRSKHFLRPLTLLSYIFIILTPTNFKLLHFNTTTWIWAEVLEKPEIH